MDKNDFSDIEDQIRNSVQNALNYIDFTGLRDTFNTTAENTVNEVKNQIKDTSDYFEKKMKDFSNNRYRNNLSESSPENEIEKYISRKPKGKYKGIIYNCIGGFGSVAFGISTFVLLMIAIFGVGGNFLKSGIMIPLSIVAAFLVGSLVLTYKGVGIRSRLGRFRRYSDCLREEILQD